MNLTINDLRVGNLVYFPFHNEVVEVIGLPLLSNEKQGIQVKTQGTILCEELLEQFKPIPLTEELAFRIGFENRIVDKWLVLKFAGLVIYFDGQILQIEKQGSLGGVIYRKYDDNYLHDLQNLVYSLTKTELPCS